MLRVGMCFGLVSSSLHLQSQRYTLHNQAYSSSVVNAQRKQTVIACPEPSVETIWEVEILEPAALAQVPRPGPHLAAAPTRVGGFMRGRGLGVWNAWMCGVSGPSRRPVGYCGDR